MMEDSEIERWMTAGSEEQRRIDGMLQGESPLAIVDDRPLGAQLEATIRETYGVLVGYDGARHVFYCRYGTCGGSAIVANRIIHDADCLVGRIISGV